MRTTSISTFVNRHNFFLDKWLEWHTKFFAAEDIYLIYEKNDYFKFDLQGYLIFKGLYKVNIVSVDYFNHKNNINERIDNIASFLTKFQADLLKKYDVICCIDVDEFLFHPNLKNILQTFTEDYLTPFGLEIIQNLSSEKELDLNKSIISQRNYCSLNNPISKGTYSKPVIVRKEMTWGAGKHHKNINEEAIMKDDLYLLHLNKVDFTQLIEMNKENIRSGGHSEHDKFDNMDKLIERLNKHSYYIDYTPHLSTLPKIIKENFTI